MSAFAARHGINAQRIAWWRGRVPAMPAIPTLVPVTVRAEPRVWSAAAMVTLSVGTRVRVEVTDAARVPPRWFAAVVDALSRCA